MAANPTNPLSLKVAIRQFSPIVCRMSDGEPVISPTLARHHRGGSTPSGSNNRNLRSFRPESAALEARNAVSSLAMMPMGAPATGVTATE